MDVHEVEGGNWSGLSDEGDVGGDKVCSANMIDEDSVMEIVSFCKEVIKGVGELRRKDDCLPFSVVSSGVEMGHQEKQIFPL